MMIIEEIGNVYNPRVYLLQIKNNGGSVMEEALNNILSELRKIDNGQKQ